MIDQHAHRTLARQGLVGSECTSGSILAGWWEAKCYSLVKRKWSPSTDPLYVHGYTDNINFSFYLPLMWSYLHASFPLDRRRYCYFFLREMESFKQVITYYHDCNHWANNQPICSSWVGIAHENSLVAHELVRHEQLQNELVVLAKIYKMIKSDRPKLQNN
jgi:hypothetical protein